MKTTLWLYKNSFLRGIYTDRPLIIIFICVMAKCLLIFMELRIPWRFLEMKEVPLESLQHKIIFPERHLPQ